METGFILLEAQKAEGGMSIISILLLLSAVGLAIYFLYKKRGGFAVNAAGSSDDYKVRQLANDCWDSYLRLLKARGRAKACMNFLTGDGGLQSIVLEMEGANTRYGDKRDKLAFVAREYDCPRIVNYAVAHGFLTGKEWGLPSSSAPGYNTDEAYFASIGYGPHSGSAMLAKLQSVKDEQDKETYEYLQAPEIQQVKDTFPIIRDFLSVAESDATDDEVLAARNNFLKQINTILDEHRE